jgi:hypothetical protein
MFCSPSAATDRPRVRCIGGEPTIVGVVLDVAFAPIPVVRITAAEPGISTYIHSSAPLQGGYFWCKSMARLVDPPPLLSGAASRKLMDLGLS